MTPPRPQSPPRLHQILRAVPTTAAILAAVVLFSGGVHAAPVSPRPNVPMRGIPQVGAAGVRRTMADVMAEEASHAGDPPAPPILQPEMEGPDRADLPQNPLSRRIASIPEMPVEQMFRTRGTAGGGSGPFTPQTLGTSWTAATLSGTNPTSSFPPDNNGAAGPTQYIVAVNGRIVSFNKSTGVADGVMNATTNTFFTSVRSGSSTSDPMIRYDRLSNRWFISIINVSTPNRWLLAVSDAASNGVISASTVWTYYFFIPATTSPTISNGSTCLSDYPSLGIDANALYTGVSEFCGTGQPFQQTDVFVIRKSSVLSGGPIVVTAFRGLMTATGGYVGPWSARGVDNYDPASNEGYFISTDGASYGTMWLNRVANPGGTPTLSSNIQITLPTTNGPRPVPHPGNTGGYWGRLDPLDDRYFTVHIRNQQLWTAHNIGVDNTGVSQGTYLGDTRVGARWYHLNVPVNSGTPNIVEMGTVFTPSASNDSLQKNCFIPSIMVSGQGHVAMGMTTAGETANANAATIGRFANDPPGTMQSLTAITTNTNTYNPTSDPGGISAGRPRRWGDYSNTCVDPNDDMTMWTVEQFCDANNSYGVRVTKLIAPPPATPSAMADVVVGQPSVTVTLTGTSVSGSGFFDPGPNLASPARPFNHISATCTNGSATGTPPSVVSVTYVDPTTIQVTLNTASATANLAGQFYQLNVTNPDGQTVSGAVVHVVNTSIVASSGPNGSISPSGSVTVPYGTNQTFTFTADPCYSVANVLVDGNSVGAPDSYTFTNVSTSHTISVSFAPGLTHAPLGLSAAQVKTGNPAGSTTGITVNYTVPVGATSVEVWRAPFGSYPLFATPPGTGAVPALPVGYPPAGWTQTAVTASGQVDNPGTRDFWYYVAFGRDTCGDVSPVSAMTNGTLDYHLGDFSDGFTAGTGDNTVNTADASLLGSHYGAAGGSLAGFEYLDVGPTTNFTTDGRPTADGVVDFEDLVMLALNYAPHVSAPNHVKPVTTAAGTEVLSVRAPLFVQRGDMIDVPVTLSAKGGLQALSVALGWDASVVAPAGVSSGGFIAAQGGVVLSPGPGRADAALLGVGDSGFNGEGTLATMRFRALQDGTPNITIAKAVGRDAANQNVAIATHDPQIAGARPTTTELYPVIPNPTRGSSLLRYALVRRSTVNLSVYSVDGRLVKTLAHGVQDAGQYQLQWDGTDASGSMTKPGIFYVRFEADGVRKSRVLSVIR